MLGLSDTAAALRETALAGLPVQAGPAGALVVSGFSSEDSDALLRVWRVAYALLTVTGRWPLLVDADIDSKEVEPSPFDAETKAALAGVDRAARTVDPWPFFQRSDDEAPDIELPFYTQGFHGIDVTAGVLPKVGPVVSIQQLLRAAYDHVLSDPGLTARVLDGTRDVVSTDYWYVPDDVSLLLLPSVSPWLAAHWMGFWGALEQEQELAAVLWQWHQRWDVRPVACWGTMLQFEVHRPPTPGEDAFTAARQLLALSPNVDIHQWELAVAITSGEAWFAHHRP
ncbi:DUF4253 domain-containing protein [Actinoplanes sp. NPDC051513]|uniref:DUF4253 domain-containing protein n=1 Tax=Actinoplanes sp. NPDC051513 TaxID=3363908 RepID=UPI00379215AA